MIRALHNSRGSNSLNFSPCSSRSCGCCKLTAATCYLPESLSVPSCGPDTITLVLPMFTRKPFDSIPDFKWWNFSSTPGYLILELEHQHIYRSSYGQPVLNIHDKASRTIMNNRGIYTESWWTPTCIHTEAVTLRVFNTDSTLGFDIHCLDCTD